MSARSSRRALVWCAIGLALAPAVARAQDRVKDDPRARAFFDVGAEAYGKGQYLLAVDAFQEAYAITERPGLLFSIAQAYQRQFRASGDERHLEQAIDHYRRYLARVSSGGRSAEASEALNKLLLVAERLHPVNRASPARSQIFGRLLLSSRTPNVTLTVNGDVVETLPTALELPADQYRVVAEARGYESRTELVPIVAGGAFPLAIELRALPARLELTGPTGAEAFVDGRSVGWLPVAALSLPAGEHWVSVRRAGYRTASAPVRLERGQSTRVELQLETTLQRNAAWVVGAGALVGVGLTGVLAGLAYDRDREARTLDERRRTASISVAEVERLNDALDARDELRAGAAIAGVASVAMIGSALLLYVADSPAPPLMPATHAAQRSGVAWRPLAGPLWVGASATF